MLTHKAINGLLNIYHKPLIQFYRQNIRRNADTDRVTSQQTGTSTLVSCCLDRMDCDKKNKWLIAAVFWANKVTVAVCILVHKAMLQKLMDIRLYTLCPRQEGHFSSKSLPPNCNFCTNTSLPWHWRLALVIYLRRKLYVFRNCIYEAFIYRHVY
jgi:hypothetical protein